MNTNKNKETTLSQLASTSISEIKVARKRRHFRDDFKRQVLADIASGKLYLNNVIDPISNKQIKPLLIERWKDQFRTQNLPVPESKMEAKALAVKGPSLVHAEATPSTATFTITLDNPMGQLAQFAEVLSQFSKVASQIQTSRGIKRNVAKQL